MPTDKSGRFHNSTQRAMAADKAAAPAPAPKKKPSALDTMMAEPPASAEMDHLRDLHAEAGGGKKLIVSRGEDGSITSHQIGDSGEPEGPHTHEDIEALKEHMDQFFADELGEPELGGSEEDGY
jgi:hypothetical protein